MSPQPPLPSTPPQQGRVQEFEAWWALIARVLGFFLGASILGWQAFFEDSDRVYLMIVAIGLMGPAAAQTVAQMFSAMRGTPTLPPPEAPPAEEPPPELPPGETSP
jgi:hypothetical protein